jgi:hypothetical protein
MPEVGSKRMDLPAEFIAKLPNDQLFDALCHELIAEHNPCRTKHPSTQVRST